MNAPADMHLKLLDAARLRMHRAKVELTRATQAIHRRDPGAAGLADQAIAELTAARRELNRLTDMAPGPWWAEMARIGDEQR